MTIKLGEICAGYGGLGLGLGLLADVDTRWVADVDAGPAQAWDDEAWAAFTWRMQTSPVFNARRK